MAITVLFTLDGKRFPYDIQSFSKQPHYPIGKRFPWSVKNRFSSRFYILRMVVDVQDYVVLLCRDVHQHVS